MKRLGYLDELHLECCVGDLIDKCECKTDQDFEDFYDYITQLVELTIEDYKEEMNEEKQKDETKNG